jgi:hypothetical protein
MHPRSLFTLTLGALALPSPSIPRTPDTPVPAPPLTTPGR